MPPRRRRGHPPGDSGQPKQKACHLFLKNKSCRFGEQCKFSHDVKTAKEPAPAQTGHRENIQTFKRFLRKDLPGHLSADGPRHDNDHADIADIAILPTPDEIRSARSEYLPTIDPTTWHHPSIRGRLDREFRLLREDTVGQLRDVVRTELEYLQRTAHLGKDSTGNKQERPPRDGKDGIQYCIYDGAVVSDVSFDGRTGVEFLVQFDQPANKFISSKTPQDDKKLPKKRQDWWTFQANKRLQPGGLLCSIDALGSVTFFTVSDSTLRTGSDDKHNRTKAARSSSKQDTDNDGKAKFTLADDAQYAYAYLNFPETEGKNQLPNGLAWFRQCQISPSDGSHRHTLVEFPGILIASFLHTLQALQSSTKNMDMPFSELIAPDHDQPEGSQDTIMDIPPPQYALRHKFVFDMSCLTEEGVSLEHSVQKPATAEEICAKTRLDETQSSAVLEALSRSLALMQGPPGTGKTFAGVEILKHILDCGTEVKVLRMGGQSKSERLRNLNLRDVVTKMEQTTVEKNLTWRTFNSKKHTADRLVKLFAELAQATTLRAVAKHLQWQSNGIFKELFKSAKGGGGAGTDDFGFTTVSYQDHAQILCNWYAGKAIDFGPPAPGRRPLSALTTRERRALAHKWQAEAFDEIKQDIESVYAEFLECKKAHDMARKEVDLRCIEEANVVGMTTTGLARNRELLKNTTAKVLLCEEAGEVLEAHMLTSFLPSIEHAILIGDHQQLRPQVQNYEFSVESRRGAQYAFDTSLFERLVSPCDGGAKIPFSKLSTQRRMHPSISALIRASLYPSLEDGANVALYPEVSGMARRLFWLDHDNMEDGVAGGSSKADPSSMSRTSLFEVEMTAALVSHLFKQGTYKGGDIAVLTPYLGQMMLLRHRLSAMFELTFNDRDAADLEAAEGLGGGGDGQAGTVPHDPHAAWHTAHKAHPTLAKATLLNSVRVATVDNFQGEEAKVVIVSLVRSNKNRQCGFLRTSNRINVLLSRAKHGMYIIGNSDTCAGIPMWIDVMAALRYGGNMGPEFPVQCPRHPEGTFMASQPDHFIQFAPDGGCLLACDKRLACGHSCTGKCHSDVIHAAVKCLEACPRSLKGCSHACPRVCGDPCEDRCRVVLQGGTVKLPCGHELADPLCWQKQNPARVTCKANVERTIPGCGHLLGLPCFKKIEDKTFACSAPCGTILPCGHTCARMCRDCNLLEDGKIGKIIRVEHGVSATQRDSVLRAWRRAMSGAAIPSVPGPATSHACPVPKTSAHRPVPIRSAPCHVLLRVTGFRARNAVPNFCLVATNVCANDDILNQEVDFIVMSTYRDTNLNEDPCIFPPCGHILTMSSMDGIMDMAKHYTMGEYPTAPDSLVPVAVAASSEPFDMKEIKVCPHCRGSLRDVARYGRIVRRAVLDESTKRFIRWARQRHGELASELMALKDKLERDRRPSAKDTRGDNSDSSDFFAREGRTALMTELLFRTDRNRHMAVAQTRREIAFFVAKADADEQPFRRVADLVRFARNRRRQRTANGSGDGEYSQVQGAADQQAKSDNSASALALAAAGQFQFDESVIQIGSSLHASVLLMRCDILALESIVFVLSKASVSAAAIQAIATAFQDNKMQVLVTEFEEVVAAAKSAKYVKQQVEGHICIAHLGMVLWRLHRFTLLQQDKPKEEEGDGEGEGEGESFVPNSSSHLDRDRFKERATEHVRTARALLDTSPSSAALFGPEVDSLETALDNLEAYQPVTAAEMKAVYTAMAAEFSGSGHWYTCANGHPFTVGECGMPMQEAQCPECGAPVGGQDHENAEGVVRAEEIEALGQEVGRMAV